MRVALIPALLLALSTAANAQIGGNCGDGTTCPDTTGDPCSPPECIPIDPSTGTCTSGCSCTTYYYPAGTACSKYACQVGTTCNNAGNCVGGSPKSCPGPSDSQCQYAGCAEPSGCYVNNYPDTRTCNDGNPNTYNDHCISGRCTGTPITCPPNTDCISYAANGTSMCAISYAPSTTPCARPSSDTNVCHAYFCDGSGTCRWVPAAAGTACNADNSLCTPHDACDNMGNCVADTAHQVVCQPMECNTVACNPSTGMCVSTPITGTCGMTGACYSMGMCVNGACNGHPLMSGTACSTGNPCQQGGQCNGSGVCNESPKIDGSPCPTPNGCSTSGACMNGGCACTPPMISVPDMSMPMSGGGSDGGFGGGGDVDMSASASGGAGGPGGGGGSPTVIGNGNKHSGCSVAGEGDASAWLVGLFVLAALILRRRNRVGGGFSR